LTLQDDGELALSVSIVWQTGQWRPFVPSPHSSWVQTGKNTEVLSFS